MLESEYKARVEELIHCESLQQQIHFYLRMFVPERCNRNLRISIINMSFELAKYMDYKSVSLMLRNIPRGSVENANEFVTEYWQQMRLAIESEYTNKH